MQLPPFKKLNTPDRVINQIQENSGAILSPLIEFALTSGQILTQINLVSGSNSINHLLGRPLLGWFVVRQRGVASNFYDTQDSNPSPAATLILNSSAEVNVDLIVF